MYRGVAAAAIHRVGVTDWLTVGGAFTGDTRSSDAGFDVAGRLPVGEIELDGRISRTDRVRSGRAASASYLFRGRWLTLTGIARAFSDAFVAAGSPLGAPPPRWDAIGSAAVAWSGVTVEGQWATAIERTGAKTTRYGASFSRPVAAGWTLSATALETMPARSREAQVTLTRALGGRMSASVGARGATGGGDGGSVAVQQALPVGPGIGWTAQWRQGQPPDTLAFQAQSSAGRFEVRRDTFGTDSVSSASAAGSIVLIGGRLIPARPLDGAFALVRVGDGVPDVRAYASNQLVGRTDDRGDVLLPSLVSYSNNRISIDDRDLPLDVEVPDLQAVVRPGLRGGAIVSFAARRGQMVDGRFIVPTDRGTEAPANGLATADWDGGRERAPLGAQGEFFFEQAEAGVHDVRVLAGGHAYVCALRIVAASGLVQHTGDVVCRADLDGAGRR